MLVVNSFGLSYGDCFARFDALLDVVDCDITMTIAYSYPILTFAGKSATSNRVVSLDMQLRESWVLQSPETKQPLLQGIIIHAVDVIFTVPYRDEVLIPLVDVDTGDLTALSQLITLKLEQWLNGHSGT